MTKHTVLLLAYVCAVVAVTSVHDPVILGAGLVLAAAAAGRRAAALAKRAALAVVIFNGVVSVSYVVVSLVRNSLSLYFLALINLRVFLLTFMTFLMIDRVNLFKALSFSRGLSYVLVLAMSQIVAFRRLFEDVRLAFRSRTTGRVGARDVYRHGASAASLFVRKSLEESTEVTDAMTSRGFFDD